MLFWVSSINSWISFFASSMLFSSSAFFNSFNCRIRLRKYPLNTDISSLTTFSPSFHTVLPIHKLGLDLFQRQIPHRLGDKLAKGRRQHPAYVLCRIRTLHDFIPSIIRRILHRVSLSFQLSRLHGGFSFWVSFNRGESDSLVRFPPN